MITETKDIFYLVLSFCVLWFTIFVCWLLYYFIAIMREARAMTRDVRRKIEMIEEAISAVRQKIEKSLSAFTVVADGFKYALKFLGEGGYFRKKTKKQESKKTKGKKEELEEEVEEFMEGETK